MRLSDVQPKKNFGYIFVQFPGMKMNVPMLSRREGKAVNEDVALCVELDGKEKVNKLYFVRTQSIQPFDFTDEGIGAKAFYRVIKEKEVSQDSLKKETGDLVTVISKEVKIIQKKTEAGYHFILLFNGREVGLIASIEKEVIHTEKELLQSNEKAQEKVSVITESQENMAVFKRRAKKKILRGGHAFQDIVVIEPIRILLEGVKRKVTVFSPAALDFIGPGDQHQSFFLKRGW